MEKTRESPNEKGKEGKRESDILKIGRMQRAAAKRAWATWKEEKTPIGGLLVSTAAKFGSYEALKAAGIINQNDDLIDLEEIGAQAMLAKLLTQDPEKAAEMLGIDPKYAIFGNVLVRADLNLIKMNAVLAVLAADHEGIDLGTEPEAVKQLQEIIPKDAISMLTDAIRDGDEEKFKGALALV